MPKENGFEFLDSVKTSPFLTIFITAYTEHAIRAFKANAIDYILKPVDEFELLQALQKKKSIGLLPLIQKSSSWLQYKQALDQAADLTPTPAISWQTNAASFCRLSHGAGTRYYPPGSRWKLYPFTFYRCTWHHDLPPNKNLRKSLILPNFSEYINPASSIFIFLNLTALQKAVKPFLPMESGCQ